MKQHTSSLGHQQSITIFSLVCGVLFCLLIGVSAGIFLVRRWRKSRYIAPNEGSCSSIAGIVFLIEIWYL